MSDNDNGGQRARSRAEFGETIKRLRTDHGLTQARLAELAGLATDAIQGLEKGGFSPGLDTLRKLAGGLGMRLSEVFDEFETRAGSAQTSGP